MRNYSAASGILRILTTRQTCLTQVTALAVETSDEWLTGRRYLATAELNQERSRERERRWSYGAVGKLPFRGNYRK